MAKDHKSKKGSRKEPAKAAKGKQSNRGKKNQAPDHRLLHQDDSEGLTHVGLGDGEEPRDGPWNSPAVLRQWPEFS